MVGLGVLVVAALAVAGWSTWQLLDARHDADVARRAAGAADAAAGEGADALVAQQAFAAQADVALADARRALAAVDDGLDAVSADHLATATELGALLDQLAALEASVAGAEGEAFASATLVDALAGCLDGVSDIVNQLSIGDHAGAVRTSEAIAPACAAVGAAIR